MILFKSKREKRLWFVTMLVVAAIFSTLLLGQPLQQLFSNQNFQAALFWLGMFLTAFLIIYHGLKSRSGNYIIGVYIGYMFEESKRRPIYLVETEKGFEN